MTPLLLLLILTSFTHGLPDGFIYTGHLNVSYPILVSLRYGTNDNFVGAVVRGYENIPSQGAVVTVNAGEALALAQEEFVKDGYRIVIYVSFLFQFFFATLFLYPPHQIGFLSSIESGGSFHGMV